MGIIIMIPSCDDDHHRYCVRTINDYESMIMVVIINLLLFFPTVKSYGFQDNDDDDDDNDDDMYIMVKCMSVCMFVTFLLILPSPCHAWLPLCTPASHLPPGITNNSKFFIIMMNVNCRDDDD